MPLLRKVCKYCISLCASFAQNVQWVNKFTLIKYQLSIFTFLCHFIAFTLFCREFALVVIYAFFAWISRDQIWGCVNFLTNIISGFITWFLWCHLLSILSLEGCAVVVRKPGWFGNPWVDSWISHQRLRCSALINKW